MYTYNASGELTKFTEKEGKKTAEYTYSYDSSGNRIKLEKDGIDRPETVSYKYDNAGLLIEKNSTIDGKTVYEYDENGSLVSEQTAGGEEITYEYTVEQRLSAVREGGALLMAASYDGDGNRVFQISRSKAVTTVLKSDTSDAEKNPEASNSGITDPETPGSFENNPSGIEDVPSSNQTEVHTYYEKIYVDPADSIFWYGFGQGLMNFFGNINSALSSYLSNWFCTAWDYVTGQYDLVLHSETEYSDADIEVMKAAGLSENEISEIVNLCVANDEQKVVSYEDVAVSTASASTDTTEIIIPVVDNGSVNDYAEYELTYYVNDINTANTQVLMTYGGNASEKSVYTYGVGRVSEEKVQEDETGEISMTDAVL